jgi:hypothetical protein
MPEDDPLKDVLSMLSQEQLAALKAALGQTTTSDVLSPDQISALRAQATVYQQAQRQAAEAAGVLWNAQLDLAITSGKPDAIQQAIGRPAPAFYDNCSCGGGGGGSSYW